MYRSLQGELAAIRARLHQEDALSLATIMPAMRSVFDTMAILGMGYELKLLQTPFSDFAAQGQHITPVQQQALLEAIDTVVGGLAALEPASAAEKPLFLASEEAQQALDTAYLSVVGESRKSLEQAKEAIIEFVANQWDRQCLQGCSRLSGQCPGQPRHYSIDPGSSHSACCERYVQEQLLDAEVVPTGRRWTPWPMPLPP